MEKKDPKIKDLTFKNDLKRKNEKKFGSFSPNKGYFKRPITEKDDKNENVESLNYPFLSFNFTETKCYLELILKEFSKLLCNRHSHQKYKTERLYSVLNDKISMSIDEYETDKNILGNHFYKDEILDRNLAKTKVNYLCMSDDNLREGSTFAVRYLTESGRVCTERYHVIHLRTIIKEIINVARLKKISIISLVCKLSITTLSSYSPNIFWNIVRIFSGKVITGISKLVSVLSTNGYYLDEDEIDKLASILCETNGDLELSKQLEDKLKEKIPYLEKMHISYVSEIDSFGRVVANNSEGSIDHSVRSNETIDKGHETVSGLRRSNRISFGVNNDNLIVEACIDSKYKLFKASICNYPDKWKKVIYKYCILNDINSPILIKKDKSKGRCVIAGSRIRKDEFVLEYKGYLITNINEAQILENIYEKANKGCYMYYFKCNDHNYCIDATEEGPYFGPGRLINHSKKNPNLTTKIVVINEIPRLFFTSKRDLECGEELLFDYGDKDPISILHHPWLLDS
ncbi:hypothetical protein FG379_000973 [Cryptosporidium bovis]|uniref:uncharacterized protein n=1 Tax=Cryptosporidium bovis TaxID=310047 RepID=UPI003519FE93|nr:hypothetical protein FG379_000973 [Cryptosporidium bovis]